MVILNIVFCFNNNIRVKKFLLFSAPRLHDIRKDEQGAVPLCIAILVNEKIRNSFFQSFDISRG